MKTLLATAVAACLAVTPAAMATTFAKPGSSSSGSGALIIEPGAKPTGSISSSKSTGKKATTSSKPTKSGKSKSSKSGGSKSKGAKTTAPVTTTGASPANIK